PRRREEWLKFLRLPQIDLALMELFDLGIFEEIMPSFHQLFLNDDRREEFLSYLRQFNYYDIDFSDNTELFSAVLISYIYSTLEKEFKIDDYIENEKFLLFCRDELGVFKAEVGSFFQSIQFINPLKNKEHYLKKGERRQRSLVSHQSFFLSLKLGLLTHQLSQTDYAFWLNEYRRFYPAN
ncbi:MAG: hypothetical protein ACXWQQ_04440, partial [Pseudobdellovibrio sp.]